MLLKCCNAAPWNWPSFFQGAVNVPLFDDEARALVGTDFKRKGRYEAESTGGV